MQSQAPEDARKGEFDAVSNHAKGPFAPHGAMEVVQRGIVNTGYATGPFNVEFMNAYRKMWVTQLSSWGGKGAIVVATVFQNSLVVSLEALAVFEKIMKASGPALPKVALHIWLIPEDIEGRGLMLPLWKKATASNGIDVEIFTTEAQFQARIDEFVAAAPQPTT